MTDRKQALTVAKLIELLKEQDPEAPVVVEGCDCWGWAGTVSVSEGGYVQEWVGAVVINRD